MSGKDSDEARTRERAAPSDDTQLTPKRRRLDAGIDTQTDPPMEAYRKCEKAVRELLSQFVQGEAEAHSLAAAVMTCAQDYALTMARFYREARESHGAAADAERAAGDHDSSTER